MTPPTRYGIAFRDNVVRLASHVPGKELLIRSQINRSNAFTLDDYSRHLAAA
ncbi:hypothetical protein [Streptomyces sp. NBC_00986]|uniref:hypothetical protein n=1 Tax=Streptomyces sp. NBC_00986 TaxID=2903702 RepID=UPI0038683A71|nr:hypothetical protein OG504_05155 [Streptomyces sp. NBC_00986]